MWLEPAPAHNPCHPALHTACRAWLEVRRALHEHNVCLEPLAGGLHSTAELASLYRLLLEETAHLPTDFAMLLQLRWAWAARLWRRSNGCWRPARAGLHHAGMRIYACWPHVGEILGLQLPGSRGLLPPACLPGAEGC